MSENAPAPNRTPATGGIDPAPLLSTALALVAAVALAACAPSGGDGGAEEQPAAGAAADESPVMSAVLDYMDRQGKNLVAAARLMPADTYGFSPTDRTMTFAEQVAHTAQTTYSLCGAVSGTEPPETPFGHDAPKDTLVAALQGAFEYCGDVLEGVEDADLGAPATLFGSYEATRATGAVFLIADWADHYGHFATYLRLNGILPPTAREEGEEEDSG